MASVVDAGALPVRSDYWPGTIVGGVTVALSVMPAFAVGALAAPIGGDLHLSNTALGLALSSFYGATALGSPIAKRFAAHMSVATAFVIAAICASSVMALISQAHNFAMLMTVLIIGGLTNGLVQPAAGRMIAANTPAHRRSLAAGVVSAGLVAATFVPGLLVAFIVPDYGWRAAMVVGAIVALLPVALAPIIHVPGVTGTRPSNPSQRQRVGKVLVLWVVAAALAATVNAVVALYFVQLGVRAGLETTISGNLLTLSAILAIAVRIFAGAFTDRAPRRNPAVISAMMLAGAIGMAFIAIDTPVTFIVGAALAFSAGWGWSGLLLAATLRLAPHRTENAGHMVQMGVYAGATVAPFTFSALSGAFGSSGAVLATAAAAFVASVAMAVGAALLRTPQSSTPQSTLIPATDEIRAAH